MTYKSKFSDKYKSDENDGQRVSGENDYSREIAKNHVNVGEKENDVPIPPQAKNKEDQHENPNSQFLSFNQLFVIEIKF